MIDNIGDAIVYLREIVKLSNRLCLRCDGVAAAIKRDAETALGYLEKEQKRHG